LRNLLVLALCVAALGADAAAERSNEGKVQLQIYSNWPDARTFLGCLNCAADDPTSIWNPASTYGWANPDGVWSRPSLRHVSYRHLVCDTPLTAPSPTVLDQYHSFYYLLTVDALKANGICAPGMSRRGCDAVRALCEGKPAAAVSTDEWTDIAVDTGPLFRPHPEGARGPAGDFPRGQP
jgi:hypothetical protein